MYTGLHPLYELLSDAISAAELSALEMDVLRRLYGLDGDRPEEAWQVAADFYVSVDQVSLLEAQGLHQVRDTAIRYLLPGASHPCASLWRYVYGAGSHEMPGAHACISQLVAEVGEDWLPPRVLRRLLTGLLVPEDYFGHWTPELARSRLPQWQRSTRARFERVQKVLGDSIIWPRRGVQLYPADFRFVRRRNVCRTRGRLNGFWSGKLERFVACESNMEARFYYFGLEMWDRVRWYQEQPLEIRYDAGGGRMAYYYPDIAFGLDDGRIVIVEVKPFFRMALADNLRKWTALRRYCEECGYGLLVTDGRHGIQYYTGRPVRASVDRAVVNCIRKKGVMTNRDFKKLGGGRKKMRELLSIILKRRLVWTYQPFEVRAGEFSRLALLPGRLGMPQPVRRFLPSDGD